MPIAKPVLFFLERLKLKLYTLFHPLLKLHTHTHAHTLFGALPLALLFQAFSLVSPRSFLCFSVFVVVAANFHEKNFHSGVGQRPFHVYYNKNYNKMELELLKKYFERTATPEEKRKALHFFYEKNLNPENEEELRQWWERYQPEANLKGPSPKILRRIHQQIRQQENPSHSFSFKRIAATAAILIIVSASFILYKYLATNPVQNEATAMIVKMVPNGAKLHFELPDGTSVNLNSNSRLEFPAQFDTDIRNIILEGEAYFEVSKDPAKPFVVECHGLTTTVLGTSFNISSYHKNVVVSVTSGKVRIDYDSKDIQPTYLTPGEQVNYDADLKTSQIQHFDLYKTIAWKEGILIFENNSLLEIIEILQRWYGVTIEVHGMGNIDQVKWAYTGDFENESLEMVLNGIAFVKGFSYKINGRNVQLYL